MNIVVTGASRGLGRGFVEYYLEANASNKVLALTGNPEALTSLAKKYSGRIFLGGRKDFAAPSEFSSVDLLINNAGVLPVEEHRKTGLRGWRGLSWEELLEGFEGNLKSALETTQVLWPLLEKSSQPKIVFMSSLMGSIADNSSGGYTSYRTSKAALNMLMKSLSLEKKGWSVAALHPGWVKTDMGGRQAPLEVSESIVGLARVIEKLGPKDSGVFLDYLGRKLPW